MRAPAVAGTFYPADASELAGEVRRHLTSAKAAEGAAKAIVGPHAGYAYSGPIAASAYRWVQPRAVEITRVVLAGPSHHVPVGGLAVPTVDAFETPIGQIPLDREAIDEIRALPQVVVSDAAHDPEHSLEAHLPFLQEVLGSFRLVPLSVDDASPNQVAEVLEALWGGPETLVVISTDLSHYRDYAAAQRIDARTCAAIEAMRPQDIGHEQACGRVPLSGLLRVAQARGLGVRTVDLRNSGDTAGPRAQVVGYGAWVVA